MSKHTPGPWRATSGGRVVAQNGRSIVQVCRVGDYADSGLLEFCRERWDADTRLIASAPAMLLALEMLESVAFGAEGKVEGGARMARIAIAKAKGETP